MRKSHIGWAVRWFPLVVLGLSLTFPQAAEMQLEARLIWGTNDDKSPNPKHRKMDGEVAKKLGEFPFKWKNFFEVNRTHFKVNSAGYTKVSMSDKCVIEVKDAGNSRIDVRFFGEGKFVNRLEKPLPKGEMLAIGGDAQNNSAWFVVIQQIEKK